MKTVFFCNLIWEMLIERRAGGDGGGGGSAPSAASYYDWLSRLAPLIQHGGWQRERGGGVNLSKGFLKSKRRR